MKLRVSADARKDLALMTGTVRSVRMANMVARKANPTPPASADDNWIDEPITDAEWAAMPDAERQAILEAEAEIDRGEYIPHEVMMAKLDTMIRKFQAKAAKLR